MTWAPWLSDVSDDQSNSLFSKLNPINIMIYRVGANSNLEMIMNTNSIYSFSENETITTMNTWILFRFLKTSKIVQFIQVWVQIVHIH